MKKMLVLVFTMLISVNSFTATINFTIPDEKLPRVTAAMKGLYPVPMSNPPEPAEGEGREEPEPLFTDGQWAKEVVRRWIITQVKRHESRVAMEAARDSVLPDDSIAQ